MPSLALIKKVRSMPLDHRLLEQLATRRHPRSKTRKLKCFKLSKFFINVTSPLHPLASSIIIRNVIKIGKEVLKCIRNIHAERWMDY